MTSKTDCFCFSAIKNRQRFSYYIFFNNVVARPAFRNEQIKALGESKEKNKREKCYSELAKVISKLEL